MASDMLERPAVLPPEFQQAADPYAPGIHPQKVMISLPLDADLVAYFQSETEAPNWQEHMNGVLRFYMQTNLIREADFEANVMMKPEPR